MNQRQKLIQKRFLNNEKAVISRLQQVYNQSMTDINGTIANLDSSIAQLQRAYNDIGEDGIGELAQAVLGSKKNFTPAEAQETLQSMIQSKVYQKKYQEALQKQVGGILDKMHTEQYKTVSEYLEKCYEDGFVGTMFDLQGQGIPLCFPLDQESMVRAVQLDSKIVEGYYRRMGEDIALLKNRITAEVSRGISTGMSYQQVAQQLAGKTTIGYTNAIRIARTEGHRIQCQAGMDACSKAKDMGADVVKQWDSTLDGRTRHSHAIVDGEVKELDEKFSNGLMFPGDPDGRAAEVINCRCALLQRARWAVGGGFTKMNNFTGQLETFDSPSDYDDFKKGFFSKENVKYMNYVDQMSQKYGTRDFASVLDAMTDREYKHYSKLLSSNPIYNIQELQKLNYSGMVTPELEAAYEKSLSKMPERHRELAESKISSVEITDNKNGSTYNLKTLKMKISQYADPDDIIHEYAHALAEALDSYNDPKFKKIMRKGLENISPLDIIYDEDSFQDAIYRVECDKFISKYQGRLYEEFGIFNGKDVSLDGMLDYFSEGYREYILNPSNLLAHDPELFKYIEGIT